MILRGGGQGEPRQRVTVVPGHPFRGLAFQLRGVSLQLGEIVERVDSVEFARVDQAHKQIAHLGSLHRLVEQWSFSGE